MTQGWLVWAGVIITPVIISSGQVLFKITGMRIEERGTSSLLRLVTDPYLLSALAIYGIGTLIWVYVLRHLSLGQAYPFMAMSFLLVPLASIAFFGEELTLRYWIGAGLIISGMVVVNS